MNDFIYTYSICCLGVLISVLLPILRKSIEKFSRDSGEVAGLGSRLGLFFSIAKPYLIMGLFSLIIGLLIVAAAQESLTDWRAALLAGYAGDSTVQKLTSRN